MNLLRIEFLKIVPYRTVWLIMATYVALLVLVMYAVSNVSINGSELGDSIYALPGIWQRLTYLASYFNLLLGILMIVLVTDEYSYRTLRQQVIDGLSRGELVLAKFYVALAVATLSTLLLLVMGLYFGLLYSTDRSAAAVFSQLGYLSYFFVQAVGYMSLAILFAFVVKRSGLSIVAFIAYTQIIEPILHFQVSDALDKYMPVKVLKSLTPMPGQQLLDQLTTPTELLAPALAVLPGLAYIGLFLLLAYSYLTLRDL